MGCHNLLHIENQSTLRVVHGENESFSNSSTVSYRYGFNGKETDSEHSQGKYDFGSRIYDGRLGRFLSLDLKTKLFPFQSPYSFCLNNPIRFIDENGDGPGDGIFRRKIIKLKLKNKDGVYKNTYWAKNYWENISPSQVSNQKRHGQTQNGWYRIDEQAYLRQQRKGYAEFHPKGADTPEKKIGTAEPAMVIGLVDENKEPIVVLVPVKNGMKVSTGQKEDMLASGKTLDNGLLKITNIGTTKELTFSLWKINDETGERTFIYRGSLKVGEDVYKKFDINSKTESLKIVNETDGLTEGIGYRVVNKEKKGDRAPDTINNIDDDDFTDDDLDDVKEIVEEESTKE
jgi:RHS repeat-associated protein